MRIKDILPEERFVPANQRKPSSSVVTKKQADTRDLSKRGKTGDWLDAVATPPLKQTRPFDKKRWE